MKSNSIPGNIFLLILPVLSQISFAQTIPEGGAVNDHENSVLNNRPAIPSGCILCDTNFHSTSKPNILIILMDDARYDPFLPNGGPAWFQAPSINRIASEGVNFQLTCPTTSQCAPSRVSIYTGLYPHHTGVINNITHQYDGLTLVQQVLKDHGYYTGFVGKYGQGQGLPEGFNWWAVTTTQDYINPPYVINGKDTAIEGNILDVYPQLALTFLKSVPAKTPFCLMFFTRAPHLPCIPRWQDTMLYKNEVIPFPSNFSKYNYNYPSFFYPGSLTWGFDSAHTVDDRRAEFQTLAGVELNVDTLLSYLDKKGITNNTLIFFTSDNGYLKGEHLLEGKEIAQEESIRLPLFIRYPKWFKPGTVITNQFATNIDIAPTMLEAADIPDTFHLDGISLRQLVTGETTRPNFFYEFGGEFNVPPNRAVRSLQYKFVRHFCSSSTEEFYDLVNDPHENTNQINNASYASLIAKYRILLDSFRTAYGDYTPNDLSCSLRDVKPENPYTDTDEGTSRISNTVLQIKPNPAFDKITLSFSSSEKKEIKIINALGQIVFSEKINADEEEIDVREFPTGMYIVKAQMSAQKIEKKFLKQ